MRSLAQSSLPANNRSLYILCNDLVSITVLQLLKLLVEATASK